MSYFKSGTWNCICMVCGRQVKSDEIKKRWDGVLVCKDDWEIRHPMDFIRTPTERVGVPFSSPEPEDEFIELICAYPYEGGADLGIVGCAYADASLPVPTSLTVDSSAAFIAIAGFTAGNV